MTARRWLAVLAVAAMHQPAGAGSHDVPFQEGVHFAIRSAGQRRWQRYHYVGYDLEPTCED